MKRLLIPTENKRLKKYLHVNGGKFIRKFTKNICEVQDYTLFILY